VTSECCYTRLLT